METGDRSQEVAAPMIEAQERERALARVLSAIRESRGDPAPVFAAIMESVTRLCDAPFVCIFLRSAAGTHLEMVAHSGARTGLVEVLSDRGQPIDDPYSHSARVVRENLTNPVQIEDLTKDEFFQHLTPQRAAAVEAEGMRTLLIVPLVTDGEVTGEFFLYRREVKSFTDAQVALVEAFASQAAIALDNVAQFREVQTRLEHEAATREILQVISRSRDDFQPVFDTILESAFRLCNLQFTTLAMVNDARTHSDIVGYRGPTVPQFDAGNTRFPLDGEHTHARVIAEKRLIHENLAEGDLYRKRDPLRVHLVEEVGLRWHVIIPLMRNDLAIGSFSAIKHQSEPFSESEIELLQTFAEQAVIAIENVRQFQAIQEANSELETRLEREEATREILQVISRSRDDFQPVFDTILERAFRLCNLRFTALAMVNDARTHVDIVGYRGPPVPLIDSGQTDIPLEGRHTQVRAILEKRLIHEDLAAGALYRDGDLLRVDLVDKAGLRWHVVVPLISGDEAIGAFAAFEDRGESFSASEIELLQTFAEQAVIAIENVRQFRELQTRLERERASREILGVISQSRDDEQPVFEAIMENAARLCKAPHAGMVLRNEADTHLELVASNAANSKFIDLLRENPHSLGDENSRVVQTVRSMEIGHHRDLASEAPDDVAPQVRFAIETEGMRTVLLVPLISGGRAIGAFFLYKRVVEPFSDDEIALVETFAAQAVIAIENVRQFRELQTRLEREEATGDVLAVISQSRDDTKPVFEAIHENIRRLCGAPFSGLFLVDRTGEGLDLVSLKGSNTDYVVSEQTHWAMTDPSAQCRAVLRKKIIHIEDMAETEAYRSGHGPTVRAVEIEGIRSFLAVPLMKGSDAIGSIGIYPDSARPFTSDQIALVQTFAAQAVIAIENVRQFRELQTRLEREEASREILGVISRSRDDARPVFDVIIEQASRLCEAPFAAMSLGSDEDSHFELVAQRGSTPAQVKLLLEDPMPIDSGTFNGRCVLERRSFQIDDMSQSEPYLNGNKYVVNSVEKMGLKTSLLVPLLSGDRALGSITLFKREVQPFTPEQVTLVETFAAQAVIAIENVRQFRELQTRLQREAATRAVLEVISLHPDDEQPVFDAIMNSAARLCDAPHAALMLRNAEDTHLLLAASSAENSGFAKMIRDNPHSMADENSLSVEAVKSMKVRQYPDIEALESYTQPSDQLRITWELERMRTLLYVPLIKGDRAIGTLVLYRLEVREFTEDDIELLQIFAAQAVIAIENVRQFRAIQAANAELETRLEREEATGEVLGVISRSRDDDKPVFDVILENAARLCNAPMALLAMVNEAGTHVPLVAHRGAGEEYLKFINENPPPRDSPLTAVRAIVEKRTIMVTDTSGDQVYRDRVPQRLAGVEAEGIKTFVAVPLVSGDGGIGAIVLYRKEAKPFSDGEIALVETFAAQAVIAIENVRQFRELQTRLQREAASREILGVISQSRDDEQPVFEVILENATRLCGAQMAALNLVNDERTELGVVALRGEFGNFAAGASRYPLDGNFGACISIREARIVHRRTMADIDNPEGRRELEEDGIQTIIYVPLLRGGVAIGNMGLARTYEHAFSDDEIALVETFAAQAVIAIENVRQFRELQNRLEREEATSEILGVISRSRDDSLPVFDAVLENAVRLCRAENALLVLANEDRGWFDVAAEHGARSATVEELTKNPHPLEVEGSEISMAYARNEVRQVEDLADTETYRKGQPRRRVAVDMEGIRSLLTVPLVLDSKPIGLFMLYRREPGRFADSQVDIVKTFAAQAAIAIQNVRQFRELQVRLEREEATRKILQVISRSRDDSGPVFDLILEDALRLCRAEFGGIADYRPGDTHVRVVAQRGMNERWRAMYRDDPPPMDPAQSTLARCILNREVNHVDVLDPGTYPQGSRYGALAIREGGVRVILQVPLLIDDRCVGVIFLFRFENQFFDAEQIELLQIFAAQAAIAIENVRQFNALVEARDDAEAALADLRKAQERLIQAEKMASLGQLTAGIAHEIKNPLNFVNNFAKLSGDMVTELAEILEGPIASLDEDDREDAEDLMQTVRENLDKINEHGRRADGIVKNMLLHSREGPSQRGTARVNSIANEALNLAYHGARAENPNFNIEMKTNLAEEVGAIECYPQDLMRVFLNIISNGMYAAYKRGQDEDGFAPEITVSSRLNGDRIEVDVRDNGQGIPEEIREKIFTPFFTTKPAGEGTGLGLSLSYDIVVKQHGGDLTVDSEPGQFTAFTISLPQTMPAETGGDR